MAELVIKIDDETYKEVMGRTEFDTLVLGIKLIEAVQSGTPLPKGHGELIDRNDLKYEKYNSYAYAIANAPTIIEADKENKE